VSASALPATATVRPAPTAGRPAVALAIGKFDGVHLGHRHLVEQLRWHARRLDALAAVLILHPDPVTVLAGRRVPLLCPLPERQRRLTALALEQVETLEFTAQIARLTPAAFLARLAQRWRVRALVAGPGFALGRDRSGDLATLAALGRTRGFEVVVVQPLEVDGEPVSSGRVRALVEAGEVRAAARLLAAPPQVTGTVVAGAARGRELGFPTANLDLAADFALPADGIYTVRVHGVDPAVVPGSSRDGVASVGVRPTFNDGARIVEVYLLDFDGDLYGRELTVDFLCRQRAEQRFESVAALVAQMHADVATARANLAAGALTDRPSARVSPSPRSGAAR
jgi:riboflavin kinase/FMN adenylyltransferase